MCTVCALSSYCPLFRVLVEGTLRFQAEHTYKGGTLVESVRASLLVTSVSSGGVSFAFV
jgi:hypothetical protein